MENKLAKRELYENFFHMGSCLVSLINNLVNLNIDRRV